MIILLVEDVGCDIFKVIIMLVEDAACWWGKEEIDENIRMLREMITRLVKLD